MEHASQIVANAIISGSIIALIGISFGLVYWTGHFFNFSHGAVFTAGAYALLAFKVWLGLPLLPAALLAIATASLLGSLLELSVYRPLRRADASSLVLLLVSLGAYVVLQNVVSLLFGDDTRTVQSGLVAEGISILGARITPTQALIVVTNLVLMAALTGVLKRTRYGRAIRAVASDPELSGVSGIRAERVVLGASAIGSALAGLAGILVAMDVDMVPTMGMNALMLGMVAVIIGGTRSIFAIALGALFLGLGKHLAGWYLGAQWQDAIAFVILLAFLLIRPQGFLGRKIRTAMV